jgi:hypothetical protein
MQRNPYWPLKGPSFFSLLRFCGFVYSCCPQSDVSSGAKFRGADGKLTCLLDSDTLGV